MTLGEGTPPLANSSAYPHTFPSGWYKMSPDFKTNGRTTKLRSRSFQSFFTLGFMIDLVIISRKACVALSRIYTSYYKP